MKVVDNTQGLSASFRDMPVRRLRILTDSQRLNPVGGIEVSTFQDATALAERQHTVEVMYGSDGEFRSGYVKSGVFLDGPVSFNLDLHRPLRGLLQFIKPARRARAWKPDVLWLNRFEHIFWAQAVARWSRCPIVCHLHHMPNFKRTALASRGVVHFIAVSHYMRERWIEAGIDPEKISVNYNSFPTQMYPAGDSSNLISSRKQFDLPIGVPVVLYYGRIALDKGVGTLLEAWSMVQARHSDVVLLLVGTTELEDSTSLSELTQHLDPSRIVMFPAQYDVIPFLHAADVVVFPSHLPEGFGKIVTEGMATGRPVVASRVGAVPEILSGEMDRLLVDVADATALTSKILELLDWRQREPLLGRACADWVGEHFPFEEHVDELENILVTHARHR